MIDKKGFVLYDFLVETDMSINEQGEPVAGDCIFCENGDIDEAKTETLRRIKLRLSNLRFWLCAGPSPQTMYPIDGERVFKN